MPAGPADIGITSASASLLQNIEWEGVMSETMKKATDGTFAKAHAFDTIITGSLTMLGLSGISLGVAASGISGVGSGVTVFTEDSHVQVQDDYDESTASFECAPQASTGV